MKKEESNNINPLLNVLAGVKVQHSLEAMNIYNCNPLWHMFSACTFIAFLGNIHFFVAQSKYRNSELLTIRALAVVCEILADLLHCSFN